MAITTEVGRCQEYFYNFPTDNDRHQCEREVGHVGACGWVDFPISAGIERPEGVSVNAFLRTATEEEVHELNRYMLGFPTSRDLLAEGFQNAVHQVASDFVRYYVEGTEGCRNCGGFPHASTCFVFRFEHAITVDYMNRHHPKPESVPDPIQVLRQMCETMTQKAVAKMLNVSPQFINDVLKGRREMTATLSDKLGYQLIVTFMKKP